MGFMIVPTIASIVRGRDVGRAAGAARGRLRPRRLEAAGSLRVVFPAALSGIVAAIVLGVSRAVGETMIVLIAAGQSPSNGLNPREPHETMAAFIGATAKGDIPTGIDRVQDDLRRRHDAVRADAAHER